MDIATTQLLIIVALMMLVILVLAGVALTASSFTQLVELIRWIGSSVERQEQAIQRRRTTSLTGTVQDTLSAQPENTRTTQDGPA